MAALRGCGITHCEYFLYLSHRWKKQNIYVPIYRTPVPQFHLSEATWIQNRVLAVAIHSIENCFAV